MQQQLATMLTMQHEMNSRVHADWREQNFAWYRAIWIESAEMLDHFGWKWWKKQTPEVEQVTLELVDIWHFGLSVLLLTDVDAQELARDIQAAQQDLKDLQSFPVELEAFVAKTLIAKGFDLPGFVRLMATMELSFDELYRRYVGKNVLNFFRQDNGYQEGTYRKLWDGREDNEHLVELVATLDHQAADFKDQLYVALTERYQAAS